MNKNISYSGCYPMTSREAMIHGMLEQFGKLLRIDRADVRIERNENSAYPFRVNAHLAVPGPDVVAEGSDYTFEAALRKLKQSISGILRQRGEKRERRKSTRKNGAAKGVKPGFRG